MIHLKLIIEYISQWLLVGLILLAITYTTYRIGGEVVAIVYVSLNVITYSWMAYELRNAAEID